MRIDTGFLRSSFRASLNAPILLNIPNPSPEGTGEVYSLDGGEISLTIATAAIGDTVYGMFTANYAVHREYGTKFQSADGFVMTNVAMWQQYVDNAVVEVKRAVQGK